MMLRVLFTNLSLMAIIATNAIASKPIVFETSSDEYANFVRTHNFSSLDFNEEANRQLRKLALPESKPGEVGALMTLMIQDCAQENARLEDLPQKLETYHNYHNTRTLYYAAVGFFVLDEPLVLAGFENKTILDLNSNIIGAYIMTHLANQDKDLMDEYVHLRYYLSLSLMLFGNDTFVVGGDVRELGRPSLINRAANLYSDWCDLNKPSYEKLSYQKSFYGLWQAAYRDDIKSGHPFIRGLTYKIRKPIKDTQFHMAPCSYAFWWIVNFISEDAVYFDL